MLGAIGSVAESFLTAGKFTQIWPLPRVRSHVRLQILQTRVCLIAANKTLQKHDRGENGTVV